MIVSRRAVQSHAQKWYVKTVYAQEIINGSTRWSISYQITTRESIELSILLKFRERRQVLHGKNIQLKKTPLVNIQFMIYKNFVNLKKNFLYF